MAHVRDSLDPRRLRCLAPALPNVRPMPRQRDAAREATRHGHGCAHGRAARPRGTGKVRRRASKKIESELTAAWPVFRAVGTGTHAHAARRGAALQTGARQQQGEGSPRHQCKPEDRCRASSGGSRGETLSRRCWPAGQSTGCRVQGAGAGCRAGCRAWGTGREAGRVAPAFADHGEGRVEVRPPLPRPRIQWSVPSASGLSRF